MKNLLFNTWNAQLNQLPVNGSIYPCAFDAAVLTPTTLIYLLKASV